MQADTTMEPSDKFSTPEINATNCQPLSLRSDEDEMQMYSDFVRG